MAGCATAWRTLLLVPKMGVEPTRPYGHTTLNRARLPVPPLRRGIRIIRARAWGVKALPRLALNEVRGKRGLGVGFEVLEHHPVHPARLEQPLF